jgi:hypothetical protein
VKAKPDELSRSFAPVKLNREEIEEILTLFTNACRTVELSDEKHVYDSLDEMDNRLGKTLSHLVVTGDTPYMVLTLGTEKLMGWVRQDENRLYAEQNVNAEAPFLRVRDMVLQRQRKFLRFVFSYLFFFCLIAGDSVFSWLKHSYFHLSPTTNEIAGRIDTILFTGYVLTWAYFYSRGMSRLSLAPRSRRQSFWERNNDNLAMILIGAVIGIFGTLVGEWLKHSFWPK